MTSRTLRVALRTAYVAFLALVLLAPFEFRPEPLYALDRLGVLTDVSFVASDVVDAARNVVLFAGWGLLWFATSDTPVVGRIRSAEFRRPVLAAFGTAVLLGLGAELLQLVLPARTPSLLDAGMNALGGGAGGLAGGLALAGLRGSRRWSGTTGVPALALAVPYGAAVLLETVFPLLRHAGPPGQHGGAADRIAWSLEHFEWTSIEVLPLLDVALFLPAGVLCAVAFREAGLGRRLSVVWTALVGLSIAVVGELAHAPLGRAMELGPLVVHEAAIAAGGWLAGASTFERALRRALAGRRTAVFLLVYGVVLALWTWRPFALEPDPSWWLAQLGAGRWLPLGALGARRTLVSVADVLRTFLLFVPVGVVLAARPLRRRGGLAGPWPAVYLAFALELGQTMVRGRFFDVTDPIVAVAGAVIAWELVRRSRRDPLAERIVHL